MRRLSYVLASLVLAVGCLSAQGRVGMIGTTAPTPGAQSSPAIGPSTLSVPAISWGIIANAADNAAIVTAAGYLANTDGMSLALARTVAAGVDHIQAVYKWRDIEANVGVYSFTAIDTLIANSGTLPVVVNIAPIWDDGNTSIPTGVTFNDFSEAAVATAYKNMLTALKDHLKQRAYVLLVGNEVDTYLTTASRRTQYATFLTTIRTHARTLFGTNPFKVATTLRAATVSSWSDWIELDTATDLNSFTYYPNAASVTFAADALTDLTAMTALGSVMFQEIGLSSSASSSTPALQAAGAQTLTGDISLLVAQRKTIPVVTWSALSDLSAAVITDFGYSSGQFTAGIGIRDTANAAKTGFTVLCAYFGGTLCSDPAPPACEFSLSVPMIQATAAGVTGTTQLTASASSCAWTRTITYDASASGWLTFTPASGNGSTTLTYTAAVNSVAVGRSSRVIVGGKSFDITQDGAVQNPPPPPPCTFTASKTGQTFTASSGNSTVVSTASNAACPWTASVLDGVTWLTLDAYSGTGTATHTFTVTANTTIADRTARFIFGDGDILTVVQSGIEPPPPDPNPTPVIPCNSTTTSPTGRTPIFGWTPCRQEKLNRMWSDYLTNPTAPATAGGRWAKLMKSNADCNCRYYDVGQFDTLMFQMTGDPAYAAKVYTKLSTRFGAIPSPSNGGYADANIVREESIRWSWMLDVIYNTLTTAQQNTIAAGIATQLEYIINVYTLRVGDSDQTVGTYFGVVLFHLLRPADARATALYANAVIGGLTPTKASTAVLTNQTDITARNGILRYVQIMAEGGDWIESGEYNYGTTMLLMEGSEYVRTATGTNYFPEVTAWIPQWGDRMLALITPDYLEDIKWGDQEGYTPHAFLHFVWTMNIGETMGLLHGTAKGRQLQNLFQTMTAIYGETGGNNTMEPAANPAAAVMFLFYDPYEPADDWKTASLSYFSKGPGVVVQRSSFASAGSLFFAHWMPIHRNTTGNDIGFADRVDHFTYLFGDFQLWRNHEWVFTHPYSYGGPSQLGGGEANNAIMIHGNGMAEEYKGDNLIASQSTTHVYTTATTGGSLQGTETPPGPPPTNGYADISVHEWTRGILYVPGTVDTIVVHDRANVTPLANIDRYPQTTATDINYFGFSTGLAAAAQNKKMLAFHMPISPTIAGSETTWTTAGAQAVKLTTLLPASNTKLIMDETAMAAGTATPCVTWYGCGAWTNPVPTERKFHVKIYPAVTQQWDTFLNVMQFGTPGVVTLKSNTGGEGAHITRPGEADILAIFNGTQGANLTLDPYDVANHAPALDVVRYRGTGYTISWTASSTSTLVYLEDLDPSASVVWTINIDAAGASTIARCTSTPATGCLTTGGEYRTTVAGSGAHSFVVTGSGSAAPPDPETCPTITLSPTTLTDAVTGTLYSQVISASGGTPAYTFTIQSGSLPAGVTLATNGTLSGTPTASGTFSFTVRAAQAGGCQGTRTYSWVVTASATLDIARSGTSQIIYDGSGSHNTLSGAVIGGSGSNRAGILQVIGGSSDTLTGCTYNAVSMTVINKIQTPSDLFLYSLQLVAPATGSNTLTCTFSANTAIAMIYSTYVGVSQVNPIAAGADGGFATSTFSSTATGSVHMSVTPASANTWTVLMTRSWTVPSAGTGSSAVFVSPGYGMGVFDAGPHASAGIARSMDATLSSSSLAAGLMFALNPAP